METSAEINELAGALAKAQGAMENAKKDSDNPFFNSSYADLAAVVTAIKKPFSENGICYIQTADTDEEGGVIITTRLVHTSGQWVQSVVRMVPAAKTPQGIGSTITYARRYALQSICGVPAEDDDGNAGTGRTENGGDRGAQEQRKPSGKPAAAQKPTPGENPLRKAWLDFDAMVRKNGCDIAGPEHPQRAANVQWVKAAMTQVLGLDIPSLGELSPAQIVGATKKIEALFTDGSLKPWTFDDREQ